MAAGPIGKTEAGGRGYIGRVRIVTEATLRDFAAAHPDAATWLGHWRLVVRRETWRSIADVRRHFPAADPVVVASGRTMTVFNVRGNRYRLITGIDYQRSAVYLKRLLTHAEYDKDQWKRQL